MKSLPFYALLIMTFGLAGIEKLVGGHVPTWFLTQFKDTFFDSLPGGLTLAFYSIAILEIITFGSLTIGLIKREFLKNKRQQQRFLKSGIILAQVTFVALGFGQRLTHQFDAAGSLFFYAVLTFIAGHFALAAE